MSLIGGIARAVGKAVGKVKGIALGAIPGGGIIKGATDIGGKIVGRIGRKNAKLAAAGALAAGSIGGAAIMGHMGGAGRGMQAVGGVGRRRRINPGNPSAMRRAVRRVTAGAKMYSKLFSITHGHIKGAPRVKIRRGRRRAA